MNNSKKHITGNLCFGLGLLLVASTAQGTLIAYEGFNTTANNGTDVTTVGATGTGFANPANTNFRMDIEDGLTYSDGSGNSLLVTGKSAGMDVVTSGTQNLQLALNSPIANDGTVYMSFLVNVTSVTAWGVMTGLTTGQVGDSASPTTALEAAFRSTSSNFGIYSDGLLDQRTGPATSTGTFFVVSELNMTAETMTTYLNPTDLLDVANTSTTLTGSLDGTWAAMDSFIFSLGGDEAGTIDEIRIGTTIGDVTPVPEPRHFAIAFGFLALAFVMGRRRLSK